jgi:hypothetical protein
MRHIQESTYPPGPFYVHPARKTGQILKYQDWPADFGARLLDFRGLIRGSVGHRLQIGRCSSSDEQNTHVRGIFFESFQPRSSSSEVPRVQLDLAGRQTRLKDDAALLASLTTRPRHILDSFTSCALPGAACTRAATIVAVSSSS